MDHIDLDQSGAQYLRIAESLRRRILEGEIPQGARLPTTRELATTLGVNRNTVVAAYNKLLEWGHARPHVGRGTFASMPGTPPSVAPKDPIIAARDAGGEPPPAPWTGAFSRASNARRMATVAPGGPAGSTRRAVSFGGSFPGPDLLPGRGYLRALERAVRGGRARILSYAAPQGLPGLRRWIAEDMARRGMPTEPDEVLITNGSQQAIDLIARAFVDPGNLVLVENPTYSGAISSFESYSARLVGLPIDAEGLLPAAIGPAASRGGSKLLYTAPTFHNPTTTVLPLARRRQLLEQGAAANVLVVEDDWAGGLRFEGEDLPTLRALDREGRVIYLSTFAKKLIPGLRIGWIAAASPVIERLGALKQINDYCSSPLVQAALEEYCRSGELDRHVARVRMAYRRRRDRMAAALSRHFPSSASWTLPEGGLFLWVTLPAGIDAGEVQRGAEALGVIVSTGDPFYLETGAPPRLRLTFASASPAEIDRGIRDVGMVVKKLLGSRRKPGARAKKERDAVPLV